MIGRSAGGFVWQRLSVYSFWVDFRSFQNFGSRFQEALHASYIVLKIAGTFFPPPNRSRDF